MKQAIHPELFETKVHCNSCGITFTTHTTVPEIEVEICSACHPFYTGKQKMIDTAGRIDMFRARQAAAKKAGSKAAKPAESDEAIEEIQDELQAETVAIEPSTTEDAA